MYRKIDSRFFANNCPKNMQPHFLVKEPKDKPTLTQWQTLSYEEFFFQH